MIGLDKLQVVTIFKRHLQDMVIEDSLVKSMAMAVGEVVEENNRRLLKDPQSMNTIKLGK